MCTKCLRLDEGTPRGTETGRTCSNPHGADCPPYEITGLRPSFLPQKVASGERSRSGSDGRRYFPSGLIAYYPFGTCAFKSLFPSRTSRCRYPPSLTSLVGVNPIEYWLRISSCNSLNTWSSVCLRSTLYTCPPVSSLILRNSASPPPPPNPKPYALGSE